MSIDTQTDRLLTIADAAKQCPGRPHVQTLWRWMQRGIQGVRLEFIMVGGRRYTSAEALEKFFATRTARIQGLPAPSATPKQRERAIQRATKTLEEAGI